VKLAVAVVAGLIGALFTPLHISPAQAAPGCGVLDRPETDIPGRVPWIEQKNGRADRGYNCGVSVVGYNSLGARGGNGNMAWSGNCAYITGDGVAVVDASDPTKPRHVRTLHGPGTDRALETIATVDTADRHLLVTGKYGLGGSRRSPGEGPVDIWDTTDCTQPQLLTRFLFPSNVHNLTLSADGKRLYSTLPLQAADISDPRRPKLLRSLETDLRAAGVRHLQYAHEAALSPDGKRLYVGGQEAGDEELLIVDIHDWPRRQATVLGTTKKAGHSIRRMTIGGKAYLLSSDESVVNFTAKGCVPEMATPFGGASEPYITDISNERAPKTVSQFHLAINKPQHCAQQVVDGTNASVHYHDVDDPTNTTFALLSMWNAGLRIVDVRNPKHPTEVAYFNPGRVRRPDGLPNLSPDAALGTALGMQTRHKELDQAWAHIRYQPATGLIWLTTQSGGFWVLELEPQVRARLGLPNLPSHNPQGSVPRPRASYFTVQRAGSLSALYCTVGSGNGVLGLLESRSSS
jgi:hypothetical protein